MVETIKIVYDNRAIGKFVPDWGFSAFVETDCGNFLFDTGAKASILEENMKLFDISPNDVEIVFISHNHWDHVGGLSYILSENGSVEVFVPDDECLNFEESLPETSICVPIAEPTYISECAISTGAMSTGLEKPAHEHSLILKTQKGGVLLTGCSHPGIVNIARTAYELLGEKLFLILGGFHLYGMEKNEIVEVSGSLKEFAENIAPCHCTGEEAIEVFKNLWKNKFIEVAAGSELDFGGFDV